ncbi:MAG TPA: phosphoribosylaminoimidazolesuccinocarboxamide synthase [Chloroflexota bacterium]|nr:phosphoribosylaminoimidazolesuccinocarboxamide synthase [Chloroflexota bacterium]
MAESNIPGLEPRARGKVRDIYELGDDLLIVATDRVSAYDSIIPTPIPGKGRVLTMLSEFWFGLLKDIVPDHLITTDVAAMDLPSGADREALAGRSMLVKKAEPLPVECVARGYLAGSGWADYQVDGAVCGIALPAGLRQSEVLPEAIFTPATKATSGHDENIGFEETAAVVGRELAERLHELTLKIYQTGHDHARARGIILADTKFEFGMYEGELLLIDEVMTPDSSRFWEASSYEVGTSPMSFDKQFVRDALTESGWDREPPAPPLPPDVVRNTTRKYEEALERLIAAV